MELLIILIIFFFLMGVLCLLGFCIEYATKTKRRLKYATIFCLVADVAGIVALIILSI